MVFISVLCFGVHTPATTEKKSIIHKFISKYLIILSIYLLLQGRIPYFLSEFLDGLLLWSVATL